MTGSYLEVRELVHGYNGRPVVAVESLTIDKGEILAVIGPNGAGKSTLLRLIALLETPVSGEIRFNGSAPAAARERLEVRRKMAVMFQEPLLFGGTVSENVAYGLRLRKRPRSEISAAVTDLLKRLRIDHLAQRRSGELSGGEAQRVSLARALVIKPELLLLDEPLASLDPPSRKEFRDDLLRTLRDFGQTAIYVTHERTDALVLADRVAVMVEGRILQAGTPEEVFKSPVDETVAAFVGVETIIPGRIDASSGGLATIETDSGAQVYAVSDLPVDETVLVLVRPEEITLLGDGANLHSSARNRFGGRVAGVRDLGSISEVAVDCDCGFRAIAHVTKRSVEELGLGPGASTTVVFKASGVHVIPRELRHGGRVGKT